MLFSVADLLRAD